MTDLVPFLGVGLAAVMFGLVLLRQTVRDSHRFEARQAARRPATMRGGARGPHVTREMLWSRHKIVAKRPDART